MEVILVPVHSEHAFHNPDFLWRNPDPKPSYDVVIVGGGLHGLATAYYLAKNHGLTNIAVVERAWVGSGNAVRNTTIIRSNYLRDESAALYEHCLKLWEGLPEALDYDLLFDQRGVLQLHHSQADVRDGTRLVHALRLNGIDAEWLDTQSVKEFCPIVNTAPDIRYPVVGAFLQRRGGIARHDAVVFALARAANRLGVDLIQDCPVTGFEKDGDRVTGVITPKGRIGAGRVGLAGAGRSPLLAKLAGFEIPIQSSPLQALVSEIVDQVLNCVIMSSGVHVYVSQAHKGELVMGSGRDPYNSYAQRGSFHIIEQQMADALELFPLFGRIHLLRTWAGIVDVAPDASPIIGPTPIRDLYINCGWGTGGFKATPGSGWVFADTIANGRPHPLAAAFSLERFETGALLDEHGAAAVAH